jgi:hypothetical protein
LQQQRAQYFTAHAFYFDQFHITMYIVLLQMPVKAWWAQCNSQPRPFDMYSPQAHALFSIVVPQLYSLLHAVEDPNAVQPADKQQTPLQQQQQSQQQVEQLALDTSPVALCAAADAQLRQPHCNSNSSSSSHSCSDADSKEQLSTADIRCSMLMPDGRKCILTSVIYREPDRRSYSNTVHRCVSKCCMCACILAYVAVLNTNAYPQRNKRPSALSFVR